MVNTKSVTSCSIAAALWLCVLTSYATPLEYQVKASYLYNFLQFVTWPDSAFTADGKFNLCVVGAERFGPALDALMDEKSGGHKIVVRKLDQGAQARGARCHLLFLAGDASDVSESVVSGPGLLTIGETPGFLNRGGVINLVVVDGRIRFEIIQRAATNAGLVVSSRLLSLAVQ